MRRFSLSSALAIVAILLPHFHAWAAPPTAAATRTTEPIAVDGRLAEPAWQTAPEIGGFVKAGSDQPASQATTARILFDQSALYIGFTCHEDRMAATAAEAKERDGKVTGDDCVEVFLGPTHDRFNFMHFAVSLSGARYDASGDGAGVAADWDAPWQAAVSRGADRWTAELAIPWACLQLNAQVGGVWDLNLCREERPHGELSSWAPTGPSFGAPQSFGTLTGLSTDTAPYLLAFGLAEPLTPGRGSNRAVLQLANRGAQARTLRCELTVHPPAEHPRTVAAPVGELAPGASRQVALEYPIFEPGRHRLTLTAFDEGSDRPVASLEANRVVADLIEHQLFQSYYRDDLTIRSQVNLDDAGRRECVVTAELLPAGGGVAVARQEVHPGSEREVRLVLPTAGVAPGAYAVRLRLQRGAKVEHEQDLAVSLLRRTPVGTLRVHPRDDLTLLVDGAPFFPLGLYDTPTTPKRIAEVTAAGFNLVSVHGGAPAATRLALDRLHGAGLMSWVVLSHQLDLSAERTKREEFLRRAVAGLADHPGLLVWESIDEPAWGSQNADGLLAGYQLLRQLDPHHPVWTNHAPRNLISTLAYFNRATDIAGCDIYPVPEPTSHSNLPNRTLSVTGDETDKNRIAVNDQKPIFMVLQGFAWRALSRRDDPQAVYPTLAQQRFMAYNAILHGARGLLYWGAQFTPKPSQAWADVKTTVHELRRLTPMLVAPPPERPPHVASDTGGVEAMLRRVGDDAFVLIVNTENREAKATLTALPRELGPLRVLYEPGRVLNVDAGTLALALPAYGIVVATTSQAFDDRRPDYSEELKQVALRPTVDAMREAGNAIINPGFEFDAGAAGVPDHWDCRFPFTAELDGERTRAGRYSLKITSPDTTLTPLLVQSSVAIPDDREVELSAWVRTDGGEIEGRIYAEWVLGGTFHSHVGPWTRGGAEWQQLRHRFKTTPAPGGRLYVVVQTRGKGTAWFDDVRLAPVTP